MTIKLQSTANAVTDTGQKFLIYGLGGVGKTTLCKTAPSPVILSAEGGLLSLRKENLPYIEIGSYSDLSDAYLWAINSKEAAQFQTICLDSISEIAEVVLTEEKKKTKDPRKAYGETQDQMLALIRNFRDIKGKHVYFSAKQEYTVDGTTAGKYFAPSFPGSKLAQQVPYFFDFLFCLQSFKNPEGQTVRYLRTVPDAQYVAKDRSGALAEWEEPNLTAIIEKVKG